MTVGRLLYICYVVAIIIIIISIICRNKNALHISSHLIPTAILCKLYQYPCFSGEGAQIKHVEQSVVQNGTRLGKGVDLELYIVSSNFTQNTYDSY